MGVTKSNIQIHHDVKIHPELDMEIPLDAKVFIVGYNDNQFDHRYAIKSLTPFEKINKNIQIKHINHGKFNYYY